jgi:hypothetical protein
MKKIILIAICAGGISLASLLSAAEGGQSVAILDEINGKVLVNQGENFVPGVEGQALNAGDRVMASKSANARIVFGKDCQTDVKANTIVTIPEHSICEGGQLVTQSMEPGAGAAPGAGATGTGNTGIYTLAGVALAIAAYEILRSP